MKTRTTKRGLYRHVTRIPESDAEQIAIMQSDLERYISDAIRIASDTLRAEGIDPDTLFDTVETDRGYHVRFIKIDRDALSPEADSALSILELCQYDTPKLDDLYQKNAVLFGVRLAQAVEHLNANRAFLKPVEARRTSNKNLKNSSDISDDRIIRVVNDPRYPLRKQQAHELGLSVRQLQTRLKKLSTK